MKWPHSTLLAFATFSASPFALDFPFVRCILQNGKCNFSSRKMMYTIHTGSGQHLFPVTVGLARGGNERANPSDASLSSNVKASRVTHGRAKGRRARTRSVSQFDYLHRQLVLCAARHFITQTVEQKTCRCSPAASASPDQVFRVSGQLPVPPHRIGFLTGNADNLSQLVSSQRICTSHLHHRASRLCHRTAAI